MYILAIDTSGEECAVCVSYKNGEKYTLVASQSLVLRTQHAEVLVPMLKRVLEEWGHPLTALSHCAVTVGPGSFTGVRIGLSAAKALGLALNIPVYGISTLAAYSAPYREETDSSYDLFSTVLDARHGAVFMAGYASEGTIVLPPAYMTDRKAADMLSLIPGQLFLTGSGAGKVRDLLVERHNVTLVEGKNSPSIGWVARLSCDEKERLAPEPVYLREPDAKLPKMPVVGRVAP